MSNGTEEDKHYGYELVKGNGEVWMRLLYRKFAEATAERYSKQSDPGPLTVRPIRLSEIPSLVSK